MHLITTCLTLDAEMWIAMMSVAEDCSGISVVGHVGGLYSPGIAVDA